MMDLKDLKKLVHFARKAGVKSMTFNGLTVEFKDEILIQHRKPRLVKSKEEDKSIPAPAPLPTLDEINDFIYGNNEEAG